jgi:hypothetical protein
MNFGATLMMTWLGAFADVAAAGEATKSAPPGRAYCARRIADQE